jgi:hypothetical protein
MVTLCILACLVESMKPIYRLPHNYTNRRLLYMSMMNMMNMINYIYA